MADERRRGSWHSADGQARVEGLGGVGDEIYAPVRIGSECLTDELPADATMSVSGGEEQLGEVTGHAVAESMAATLFASERSRHRGLYGKSGQQVLAASRADQPERPRTPVVSGGRSRVSSLVNAADADERW